MKMLHEQQEKKETYTKHDEKPHSLSKKKIILAKVTSSSDKKDKQSDNLTSVRS